jgi:chaperone required for assembly of F1-ATPase
MLRKRSYKEVSVGRAASAERWAHRVLLDGEPVKTPAGAVLALPSEALARAIAEEWRVQDTDIRPQTMVLTRLANTAIDRVAPNLANAREQILSIASSDVLCYRAEAPADLVRRQQLAWDPLLERVHERLGASLQTGTGVGFLEQDEGAVQALRADLEQHDAFYLAALYAAAASCGSLVIALAISESTLDPDAAFSVANLDKIYQAERWGWDEQEKTKMAAERGELNHISRFLELLKQ